MRAAAEKAIELDPLLAEAHSALGMAYARDGQWARSEASFRRAIELDPNRSASYGDFAVYVLMQQGRIPEALKEMRIAQKSDPLSAEVRSELAYVLLSAHLYDEAAAECEKLPEDCRCWPAPSEPMRYDCLGRARVGQGRLREGIEIMAAGVAKGVSRGAPIRGYLGYAYGRIGRRDEAEKIVESDWRNPYHQAIALAGLGEKERAFAALEKMVPQGPVRLGLALAVPELDTLRKDSRLKLFAGKSGCLNSVELICPQWAAAEVPDEPAPGVRSSRERRSLRVLAISWVRASPPSTGKRRQFVAGCNPARTGRPGRHVLRIERNLSWSLDILVSIHGDPKWVGLRKDPRFQQLEKKIGFSEGMN